MAGRFSKILEFIGLVDDEPDDMDAGSQRPIPNQGYGNQSRRQSQSASRRGDYYEDRRQSTPPRPDYDARQRRNDTARYSSHDTDYRSNYDARQTPPYQPGGYQQGYQSSSYQQSSSYERDRSGYDRPQPARPQPRQQKRDQLADEFEMMDRQPRGERQSEEANVTAMRVREPSRETVIYYLRQLEECRDVINDLLGNKTVLLNLEDMDERVVQRAIDTLCGAAFALDATLRKASDKTYLIAPGTMQVASTRDTERRYS